MPDSRAAAALDPERVESLGDFLAYARAMHVQLRAGAPGWENTSLEAFLDRLIAWAEDYPVSSVPSWRAMAQLIRAGAFYE
jgi:hypothetical protein